MNVLLFALLVPAPDPSLTAGMQALFRAQQETAIRDIRIGIQADLEHRGARFFAAEGGLRRILDTAAVTRTTLAVR